MSKLYKGKTSKLIDLCDSITDCHHSTPKWTDEGKIVIRNFNVKNGKLLLDEISYTDEVTYQERISRNTPKEGDLVISREAPMGEVCIIPEGIECCLGQRLVLIKPNPNKINNRYLLYSLLSEYVQKQIKSSENTGSIVSNLRIPDLKNLNIPLNNNQEKIAAVLSALDAKIELNNCINAELENLAKTIYDYWFVQFDFPNRNGKPYKSSGGEMVYNKECDRAIPAGWEVIPINKLIDVTDGTHDSPKPSENGFHLITSKHLSKNGIDFGSAYLISEEDYININKRSQVEQNDILISMIGTIGTTYFVKESSINFAIKNIGLFKTSQNLEVSELLYLFFNSLHGKQYFISNTSGSIQNYLTLGVLRSIPLIIPIDKILSCFNQKIKPIYNKIHLNNQENQQLTQLRDWLLPMLMNGQISIK